MSMIKNANNIEALKSKDKILLTAHELFYSSGIKATGIDKIIQNSKVTKVTFYRNYNSKNNLILAYLEYRHKKWIEWFQETLIEKLARSLNPAEALAETMYEWFSDSTFRGCAFINATAEAGDLVEEIKEISRNHKREMAKLVGNILKISDQNVIEQIIIMIDGSIVHVQMGFDAQNSTKALRNMLTKTLMF